MSVTRLHDSLIQKYSFFLVLTRQSFLCIHAYIISVIKMINLFICIDLLRELNIIYEIILYILNINVTIDKIFANDSLCCIGFFVSQEKIHSTDW